MKSKRRERNLTTLVDRLEAFEERAGVRLEALGASLDWGGNLEVMGEVHVRDGMTIMSDVELQAVVYDEHGGIVAREQTNVQAKDFFGFAVFKIWFGGFPGDENPVCEKISKIRVIPIRLG